MTETIDALVIGAGPAGLMAAEVLADAGRRVVVMDAMPTPARKFLMAGKSGLNITRNEPMDGFMAAMRAGSDRANLDPITASFGPADVMAWAEALGIDLFTGTTKRVFPTGMKASPLLRAWLARLTAKRVVLRNRWRWQGLERGTFVFDTPDGPKRLTAKVVVLALGGASWPRLGSDAAWVPFLRDAGVQIASFKPANMGLRVEWSEPMRRHFGVAVKGVSIQAGPEVSRGEWVISRRGVEGGGIYAVSAVIRDGAEAQVDLAPDLDAKTLEKRLHQAHSRQSLGNRLRRVLGDPIKTALLLEWGRPLPKIAVDLARLIKSLPLRHIGPMGLEASISSAGGVRWASVTDDLELRQLPGVFVAGEMLDWEAPTGGYLLSFCLASGRKAGQAASVFGIP